MKPLTKDQLIEMIKDGTFNSLSEKQKFAALEVFEGKIVDTSDFYESSSWYDSGCSDWNSSSSC
jgi:hypothetical protein